MQFDTLEKVLTDSGAQPGSIDPPDQAPRAALPPRLSTDPETAADDLVKLVLAVIDTVRQLMERQAIRRVESGVLSDAEIERLGLTLMQLETRMAELKAHFGLADEDLDLHFGSVQDLKDILNDEG
ncbi:MAG: gas vesicle protein K [Pseudorhodobacter sp.]|nr:gas vesicle protein K [Pseudorhodobacter sp.]